LLLGHQRRPAALQQAALRVVVQRAHRGRCERRRLAEVEAQAARLWLPKELGLLS